MLSKIRDYIKLNAWGWLKYIALVSAIITLWVFSFALIGLSVPFPPNSGFAINDLAALLFGASSIAIFFLSAIFAILSLVGWHQIKDKLDRVAHLEEDTKSRLTNLEESTKGQITNWEKELNDIEKSTKGQIRQWGSELESFKDKNIKPLELQMKARVHSILGFALGEMSMNSDLEIRNPEQLGEAIRQCELAYNLLEDFRGAPFEFMPLNNFIFYVSFGDDFTRANFILTEARRLMIAAQAHDHINFILTACRAIIKFSPDPSEKAACSEILEAIISRPTATEKEKREASIHLGYYRSNTRAKERRGV